jgi:diguanylate cyclase (GGDEF)-like protein/PAS domain S-box-containing protein
LATNGGHLPLAIYPFLFGLILLGATAGEAPLAGAQAVTRYLLGFPGALLAAWAFLQTYRRNHPSLAHRPVGAAFRLAVAALAAYAVTGGLIAAEAGFYPADTLHAGAFAATTGLPVQVGRGLAGLLLAGALWPILRHFRAEARAGREADRRIRNRHGRILEATGEGILELDPMGRITYANPAARTLLGYAQGQTPTRMPFLRHLATPEGNHPIVRAYHEGRHTRCVSGQFRQQDGTALPVQFSAAPLRDGGRIIGAVVTFQDARSEQEAERQKRLAKVVYDHVPEGILVTDAEGRIQSANPAFCRATGYTEGELAGRHPALLEVDGTPAGLYRRWPAGVDAQSGWQGELWTRTRAGGLEAAWVTVNPVPGAEGPSHFIAIYSELGATETAQRRLQRLAYYDGLTGLPNRELFHDRLDQSIIHARRKEQAGAVLFVDLDVFKPLNDQHGHAIGDRLLEAIAQRLPEGLREGDTVARIAGDEFTVLLPSPITTAGVERVAEKIRAAMARPFAIEDLTLYTSVSIGLAQFPRHGDTREQVMAAADTAMYAAKAADGNSWHWADFSAACPLPTE